MRLFTHVNKKLLFGITLIFPSITALAADITLPGQGTLTDPYRLASAADWKLLADYMVANNTNMQGSYINLAADIDLTGTEFAPLGEFAGTFDGQGHVISGISYTPTADCQGVFTTIGASGVVKNLTLKGNITSINAYTAGFAGTLQGQLENCINQINVTNKNSYTAGFAAKAVSGAVLTKCINKAEITSSLSNMAGIVADGDKGVTYNQCGNEGLVHNTGSSDYTAGIVSVSLPATFIGCYNTGEIVIDRPTATSCVAGILAFATNTKGATPNLFTFTDCYNTEYINASDRVAGVLADINLTTPNLGISVTLEMTRCYNSGTIIASGNPSGNIGTAGVSCFYAPGSKFTDCYNTGTIQAEKKPYCAGVVGHFKVIASMTPEASVFDGCYNTGEIKVPVGQGSGILAYAHKNVMIRNCYNTGNITGKSTLGGILSTMASGSEIHNCWNSGNVTTTAETAAGIVANNTNACIISTCFNSGNITAGTKTAGGIAASTGSALTDCVNFGNVKGSTAVGGLVGSPVAGKTSFTRCYNAGAVAASTDDGTFGSLIGVSTEVTGYWTDANKVTDSYYVTGFNEFTLPQAGTPVTMADMVKTNLGDTWTRPADNCLPVQKLFADNVTAIVNSAAVVPATGNTFTNLTADMTLGAPAGLTWTSSSPLLTVDGTTGRIAETATPTAVTLTAAIGNVKRVWDLTIAPKGSTGIADKLADSNVWILNRVYYNIAGQAVSAPAATDGQLYIVKEIYSNGRTRTYKFINR